MVLKRPKQMTAKESAMRKLKMAQYAQHLYQAQNQQTASALTHGWVTSTVTNSAYTSLSNAMTTSATTNTIVCPTWPNGTAVYDPIDNVYYEDDDDSITLRNGDARTLRLPDGTVIDVQTNGSFTINDKDAKVIYRANRVRDFNSFVNASDKLEAFIKFCGAIGVRQSEMLDIPVKHFIAWLIVEAAKADGERPEEIATFPDLRQHVHPRCVNCGRFLARKHVERKIAFCRPVCLEKQLEAA